MYALKPLWKDMLAALLLAALCLVAWRGLFGQYFWEDDFLCIYLGKTASLGTVFGTSPNFRPLDRLSFFLSYWLFGIKPLGYNLTNAVLHLANSYLIYLLGRPLFKSRLTGLAAAAFFLTTNISSDAVFWVSARSGLIALFFLLAALNLWAVFRSSGRPYPWYYLCVLSLAMALLSKEEAVVYPLLVILADILLLDGGGDKRRWAWYSGALVPAAAYAAFQAYTQLGPATQSANIQRGVYVLGWNVPVNLMETFLYMFTPSFLDIQSLSLFMRMAASALVVAAILAGGYLAARRRESLWAVMWVAVAFLPMSLFTWELVQSVEMWFVRRYLYTSSVGAAFVFGLLIAWLYGFRRPGRAAAAAVLASVVCWNVVQLDESDMFWRIRKDAVRAETAAVTELYPSMPSKGAGVFMDGFAQQDVFARAMLRLIYDNDHIVVYPDAKSLMGDDSVSEKVLLYEKDDSVIAFPSGRAVRLKQ